MKQPNSSPDCEGTPDGCAGPKVCPLSSVAAGTIVCVRKLTTSAEISDRLREMGLREDQRVKLVSRQDSVICLVCNARVALSEQLADAILVEPLSPGR